MHRLLQVAVCWLLVLHCTHPHMATAYWLLLCRRCSFVAQHDESSGESSSADVNVAACCVGAERFVNSINITKTAVKLKKKNI